MARERSGIFSWLFLFLFCDDVGGLSRDMCHRAIWRRGGEAGQVGNLVLSVTL